MGFTGGDGSFEGEGHSFGIGIKSNSGDRNWLCRSEGALGELGSKDIEFEGIACDGLCGLGDEKIDRDLASERGCGQIGLED
jgi:hypothetical protein